MTSLASSEDKNSTAAARSLRRYLCDKVASALGVLVRWEASSSYNTGAASRPTSGAALIAAALEEAGDIGHLRV